MNRASAFQTGATRARKGSRDVIVWTGGCQTVGWKQTSHLARRSGRRGSRAAGHLIGEATDFEEQIPPRLRIRHPMRFYEVTDPCLSARARTFGRPTV
jgi:hypothetical protein